MPEWYRTARFTKDNSTTAPAESNNASGAIVTVTLALNATHPKHAAIVREDMSQDTANRRELKASLPDVQCAKVATLHGAMPARQERKSWNEWS